MFLDAAPVGPGTRTDLAEHAVDFHPQPTPRALIEIRPGPALAAPDRRRGALPNATADPRDRIGELTASSRLVPAATGGTIRLVFASGRTDGKIGH
jgi:hypothetical protein